MINQVRRPGQLPLGTLGSEPTSALWRNQSPLPCPHPLLSSTWCCPSPSSWEWPVSLGGPFLDHTVETILSDLPPSLFHLSPLFITPQLAWKEIFSTWLKSQLTNLETSFYSNIKSTFLLIFVVLILCNCLNVWAYWGGFCHIKMGTVLYTSVLLSNSLIDHSHLGSL